MKSFRLFLTVLVLLACYASIIGVSGASAHSPTMRIRSFVAVPHAVSSRGELHCVVRVSGLILDLKHMGKLAVAGHGHVQFYLDHIPADAWRHADLKHRYIASPATTRVFLSASVLKARPGKHRLVAALAKNDNILYHTLPVAVTFVMR